MLAPLAAAVAPWAVALAPLAAAAAPSVAALAPSAAAGVRPVADEELGISTDAFLVIRAPQGALFLSHFSTICRLLTAATTTRNSANNCRHKAQIRRCCSFGLVLRAILAWYCLQEL